jgi:hypothetical protein
MGDGDETKKGNWALPSGPRVTAAIAVLTIELADALFANWVRLVGIATGIRTPSQSGAPGKIESQPSCLGSIGGDAMTHREQDIREIAYFIWENEGRPDDRAEQHWTAAEAVVAAEEARAQGKVIELSPIEAPPAELHADAA